MFIAFFDYMKYRLHKGRYSAQSIENSRGKLATSANFPADNFPKPGQIIIVHTRGSFLSWLVMYFTDSIWSHTSIGADNGDIVEVTLEGTIAHPFSDILNSTDYLVIARPPATAEQERAIAEHLRSTVGVVKFSYRTAAFMGLRYLFGRDEKYRSRLSADILVTLLLACWPVRRHKRIVATFAALGISYTAIVLLNTKHRKNIRAGTTSQRSSNVIKTQNVANFSREMAPPTTDVRMRRPLIRGLRANPREAWRRTENNRNSYTTSELSAEVESFLRPILRDKGKRDLLEVIIQGFWQQEVGAIPLKTIHSWGTLAAATSPSDAARVGHTLNGAVGYNALAGLEAHLDALLSEVTSRRSPAAWFLMLKRTENCIRTVLPQTGFEVLRLAAINSQMSTSQDNYIRLCIIPWTATPKVVSEIDYLLSLSILKRNVRVAMRRVAKGQTVRLIDGFAAEPVDKNTALAEAIELYDKRISIGSRSRGRVDIGDRTIASGSSGSVITWEDLRRLPLIPGPLADDLLRDHDPYFPVATEIPEAIGPGSMQDQETIAMIAVLSAAWETLFERGQTFRNTRGVWTQHGYLILNRRSFHRKTTDLISQIGNSRESADRLWELIWNMTPRILYPAGKGRLLLDLSTASTRLKGGLERKYEETPTNVQESDFKQRVQDVIDSSPWRPESDYRALIGRTIRVNDRISMDIHAVAMRPNKLVLIDTRAFEDSEALMEGEPQAINSMRRMVEEASDNWDSKIDIIRTAYEVSIHGV